jgi:hypothetical protein
MGRRKKSSPVPPPPPCSYCNGLGQIKGADVKRNGHVYPVYTDCCMCKGTGRAVVASTPKPQPAPPPVDVQSLAAGEGRKEAEVEVEHGDAWEPPAGQQQEARS